MNAQRLFSLFTLFFFIQACSSTPEPEAKPVQPYVEASLIDSLHLIPGPPAPGSAEYKNDFKVLKQYQKTRTKAECDRAEQAVKLKHFLRLFAKPNGPLTEPEVQKWSPLFDQILKEARPAWKKAKEYWARPRPYATDESLKPCIDLESNFAYPSGHSAAGELFAKILSDLYPERKTELMKRGIEIGNDRILGGVHHPTDVRDGRVLADQVYLLLKKNPEFQKALTSMHP